MKKISLIAGIILFVPFIIIAQELAKPLLISPANGTLASPMSVKFTWQAVPDADTYQIQISTDSLFNTISIFDSVIVSTSWTIRLEETNQKYFWRVQANNSIGFSPFSDTWNLVTNFFPPVLKIPVPNDGEVLLGWASISRIQKFLIYRDSIGMYPSTLIAEVPGDQNSYTDIGLTNGITYHYAVKAVSIYDFESQVSAPQIAVPGIYSPVLVSPANNSGFQFIKPKFTWNPISSAESYRLQISTDSSFGFFFYNDSSITSAYQFVELQEKNQKYYWRVQAKYADGYSEFSETWNFVTSFFPASFQSPQIGNGEVLLT